MHERILAVSLWQTGNATAGDWVVEFPFATRLIGLKHSGSNGSKTSTIAVSGGATLSAVTIGNSGNPTWTEPDTVPDFAAADVAYTFSIASGTAIDDPMILAFFAIGDDAAHAGLAPGENCVAVCIMETGTAVTAAYYVEFPFPTRLLGIKHSVSDAGKNSTITVAGGATLSAATFGLSGNPTWTEPDTVPDFAGSDTVYTVTLTEGDTPGNDPLALLFFATGEGGSNFDGFPELTLVTNVCQVGSATTAGWVLEFPWPVRLVGSKTCGSDTGTSTLTFADGVVNAATVIGVSGDPAFTKPTTVPDYCAKDTAITETLTQTGSRSDDPMIINIWQIGEG